MIKEMIAIVEKKKKANEIKLNKFWLKHPRLYKIRYMLTAWRPITRHEYVKLAQSLIKAHKMNCNDHKLMVQTIIKTIEKVKEIEDQIKFIDDKNKDGVEIT